MEDSVFIGLFMACPLAITHGRSLFDGEFDERLRLFEGVPRRLPIEAEKVHPILDAPSAEPFMGAQECGEVAMDLVYRLHRVLRILQPRRFRSRMDFAAQRKQLYERLMRIVAVVDYRRSRGDRSAIGFGDLAFARLPDAAGFEDASSPVGRAADAELVFGKPAEALSLPQLRFRRPFREIGLVYPNPAGKHGAVLAPIEDGEDLGKPIKAGGICVSVVERRRPDGMKLENVDEEFYPFRKGYLP